MGQIGAADCGVRDGFSVSDVRLQAARGDEVERGLIGWLSFSLNRTLRVDGVTLRRTQDGRRTLSFPSRRDAAGRQHFFLRPVDDRARRDIEHQVLRALGLGEGEGR